MDKRVKINFLKTVLAVILLILFICLVGCRNTDDTFSTTKATTLDEITTLPEFDKNDNNTDLDNDSSNDSIGDDSNSQDNDDSNKGPLPDYYIATVKPNYYVNSSPYVGDSSVSDELKGVYYTSNVPGGEPQNDGTGKIWLKLVPLKKYGIFSVTVEGKYTKIENLGEDIYCISGVKSNLKVSMMVSELESSTKEIFKDYGYGISDDGKLTVSWMQSSDEPLRYVEIEYNDGENQKTEYVDASLGRMDLFTMSENKTYKVNLRAVGYSNIGKKVNISAYYMKKPKEVSFPRVEITTENFMLPTFENAIKPPTNAMGAGITNATYKQCIVTLFNENNEIVYTSNLNKGENEEFLGAKFKVRGNTSAAHAQNARYPYKVKLSEKADLLAPLIGREDSGKSYAEKDWLLLNYGEELYRLTGDAIADAVGTEWSPDYCYVSLYINGDYRGIYVLSEAVEKGSGVGDEQWRVPVDNDGFVFECDAYWWNEDLHFETPMTDNTKMYYTFKYPDSDKLNADSPQVAYLRDYIIKFENALKETGDSYLEYIDLDSFVKWLLVSDYLCITDGGGCNIYLYKKDSTDSSKINMGPNWDFDSYMGDANGLSSIRVYWSKAPFYYHRLVKKSSFQTRYKELYRDTKDKLDSYIDNAFSKIDIEAHDKLLEYQNQRFGTSLESLTTQKQAFDKWLDEHIEYMDTQFGK